MPVKAIVTGILLIIMVFLLVNFIEYFLPLSVKADLDMLCRSALLKMENDGQGDASSGAGGKGADGYRDHSNLRCQTGRYADAACGRGLHLQ